MKTVLWACRLIATAAPWEAFFVTVLVFIQGAAPALSILVLGKTVSWLVGVQNSVEGDAPIFLAFLWALLFCVQCFLSPFVSVIRMRLNEKLLAHCNMLLIERANSFAGLESFETPDFFNQIQFLRDEARNRPLNFVYILAGFLQEIVAILSIMIACVTVNVWAAFWIIVVSFPQAYAEMRIQKQSWEQILFRSPQARKMAWLASIPLDERAAKELRLFGFGDFFLHSYRQLSVSLCTLLTGQGNKLCIETLLIALMSFLGTGGLCAWLVLHASEGKIEIGAVVIALESFVLVQGYMSGVLQNIAMCIPVIGFFDKFQEFLLRKCPLSRPKNPVSFETLSHEIRFENVSFMYPGGRRGLSNVSFSIKPCETVAIVGKNGAGKSTIVKLLLRFYDPTEGSIFIDGIDLKSLDIDSWRQQISACFQDFGRYHLTIRENIGIGQPHYMNSMEKVQIAATKGGCDEIFCRLPEKFETLLGKEFGGTSLSGGEWQKIAMARAFMKEAQILVFDEPTASLDPQSEHEMFQLFQQQSSRKTTLLITHRLGSVSMASRIIVLREGRLVEDGTHEQLIQNKGEYASMFSMQASQYSRPKNN